MQKSTASGNEKIVIDSNAVLSALLRDSAARRILLHPSFQFYAPEHLIEEVEKYKDLVVKRSGIDKHLIEILLSTLVEKIIIVPKEEYKDYLQKAETTLKDPYDTPLLALALAFDIDNIWSDDKHFLEQKKVTILKTKEMLYLI